ncbi:DUF6114 domain-containing protein [Streptomyces sp. NBC_01317]|uniref:DUF6114 domain-containing protein n=1 Tax=Streptomyces sp. NBC_01317 TaxID=2903822 RepID=UPI002E0F0EFE|nr:DUF6114 domain-containing protein [Streptomyces sp. NBC_01317]
MKAESTESRGFTYWRLRFRAWRGSRPFWGGLFTLLGGIPIAYFPYGNLKLGNLTLAMSTTAGAGSLIIGVLLVTLGLTMWYHSLVRVFSGVAAILLALVSIPISNFGGFLLGYLCALVGGGLALAWVPVKHPVPEEPEEDEHYDESAEPYDTTTRHDEWAPEPGGPRDPLLPAPREGAEPNVTETTAEANGGRNSAG